jgi:uncharacterized protein YdaU (DUF1376 family)
MYAKDFLDGTAPMSCAEVGVYIRLLLWSWGNGPLPVDELRLARIVGASEAEFRRLWQVVAEKWVRTDAGWINRRLEQQRARQQEFAERQAEGGRRGATRRWGGGGSNNGGPNGLPNGGPNGGPINPPNGVATPQPWPKNDSAIFDLQSADTPTAESAVGVSALARAIHPRQAVAASLIDGQSQRRHGQHAWCDFERGKCVTRWIFEEQLGSVGGDVATREARLKAFYADTIAALDPNEPIGDDPDRFWRKQFAARFGVLPNASAPTTKGAKSRAAVQRAVQAIANEESSR